MVPFHPERHHGSPGYRTVTDIRLSQISYRYKVHVVAHECSNSTDTIQQLQA